MPKAGIAVAEGQFDGKKVRTVAAVEQFHFHAPSEHTVKGQHYDLEMHIVFFNLPTEEWKTEIKNLRIPGHDSDQLADQFTTGEYTVGTAIAVGYFFEVDSTITDTDVLGLRAGKTNLDKILGCTTSGYFYRYSGGLTTPPCTEHIEWHVQRDPIKITQGEMDYIKAKLHPNNNRATQPQGSRTVRLLGGKCD